MEEEVSYSTVVFKGSGQPPKEKKEDPTIYSEVKPKGPATTQPNGEAAAHSHLRVLALCLGILCILLLACISTIVYFSVVTNAQRANISNLTAANQQLNTERSNLQRETEELSRVTNRLNRTLEVIMTFDTFPVKNFCPEKTCQPCQTGWIQFQEKCYLFNEQASPWNTWENSQKKCQSSSADLVVIDSLPEQEFISNHTEKYFDDYHGYWIGLRQTDSKNWVWVDGRNDTLMFWLTGSFGDSGPCALMIPGRNLTASWDPANCMMENKFICEAQTLKWYI